MAPDMGPACGPSLTAGPVLLCDQHSSCPPLPRAHVILCSQSVRSSVLRHHLGKHLPREPVPDKERGLGKI